MRKILYFAALAAVIAFASCQNDEMEEIPSAPVFTATMENNPMIDRTTISYDNTSEKYNVYWEDGDEISVNGTIFSTTDTGTSATFTKKSGTDPTGTFFAYYPSSIYNSSTLTFPATQTYNAEGNLKAILPMYAKSTDTHLSFKNLCGLIEFTLKGTEIVKRITVSDDNMAMSGEFTIADNKAIITDKSSKAGITLDCGEGVQLDETGKKFYVAVPAETYTGMHIVVYSTSDNVIANMKATNAVIERNKVYAIEKTASFKDWFYFEAVTAEATISMNPCGSAPAVSLKYSTDKGVSWNEFKVGTTSVTLTNVGDKVYFKANGTNATFAINDTDYNCFTSDKQVNVGGNIMYLLNGSTPGPSVSDNSFRNLFRDNVKIRSASELKLPATNLAQYCYASMFRGCKKLTNAPVLPATTLAKGCYQYMFYDCSDYLVKAPELPAKVLEEYCYNCMFQECKNLNYIKCLATNISAYYCTINWLYNVASSGTFVKDKNMLLWSNGVSGIPSGWTKDN